MQKLSVLLLLVLWANGNYAQFVATVTFKEPVEGLCSITEVYSPFTFFEGQVMHECAVAQADIQALLNERVTFVQANPKFKLKKHSSVSTVVNCKGELVHVSIKSKSAEFNEQVKGVFRELGPWKVGSIRGKVFDTSRLWGIEVKKGVITLQ